MLCENEVHAGKHLRIGHAIQGMDLVHHPFLLAIRRLRALVRLLDLSVGDIMLLGLDRRVERLVDLERLLFGDGREVALEFSILQVSGVLVVLYSLCLVFLGADVLSGIVELVTHFH